MTDRKDLRLAVEGSMLRGKLCYLSPITEADSSTLFSWINDRELVTLNSAFKPIHFAGHEQWMRSVLARTDAAIFGIRRSSDEALVGSCQLHSISPVHRRAELQVRLGRADARGKGIGTESCGLLLQHGFRDLNLHSVFLHVFGDNEVAKRLYARHGFKVDGCLRDAVFVDGIWKDVLVMSLLSKEYYKQ